MLGEIRVPQAVINEVETLMWKWRCRADAKMKEAERTKRHRMYAARGYDMAQKSFIVVEP